MGDDSTACMLQASQAVEDVADDVEEEAESAAPAFDLKSLFGGARPKQVGLQGLLQGFPTGNHSSGGGILPANVAYPVQAFLGRPQGMRSSHVVPNRWLL